MPGARAEIGDNPSNAQPGAQGALPRAAWLFLAAALTCGIFVADSLVQFEASIAILYLAVLTMVAQGGSARDVRWAMVGTGALAVGAWCIAHAGEPSLDSILRLGFIEFAILITGALLVSRLTLRDVRDELEESRGEILTFTESVPYLLWRGTMDGKFDFLNHRFAELTGPDRDRAVADEACENPMHPDDIAGHEARRAAALASGSEFRSLFRLRHADGQYRWMSLIGRPVRSPRTGAVARWYGGISDAHEEVLAQTKVRELMETLERRVEERTEALTQSQQRFATLWEISNITFAELDFSETIEILDPIRDTGVTDLAAYFGEHPQELQECIARIHTLNVNPAAARMLGFDSLEDMAAEPIVHCEDVKAVMLSQLELPFYGRHKTEGRARLIGKDGRRVPVFYSAHRLPDEHQFSAVVDLTANERAEEMRLAAQEELARANRVATVGAFSVSVAHELNQPIASLKMDAHSVLRLSKHETPDMEAMTPALERISRSAERISDIVGRVRDSIAGHERMLSIVDLCTLARDTAELLRREVNQADAVLEVHCDNAAPMVRGDEVDLQQVLVNLILNASEAMADWNGERRVEVTVERTGEGVRVCVADSGRGITPDMMERLFEPFVTTKANGIGMGLLICRSAVARLGGDLIAYNRSGGGAAFEFTLPFLEATEKAA